MRSTSHLYQARRRWQSGSAKSERPSTRRSWLCASPRQSREGRSGGRFLNTSAPLASLCIRVGILATSHSQPRYHVMCTTRPTPGLALGGQSLRLPNGSHSDRPFTGTRWVSLACLSMDAALGCGERSTLVLPFVAHSWLIRVSFVGSSVLHSSEG